MSSANLTGEYWVSTYLAIASLIPSMAYVCNHTSIANAESFNASSAFAYLTMNLICIS